MSKLSIQLKAPSPSAWLDCAIDRFDEFLIDHAACERKASATGIQFVVRYPDRQELIDPMIRLAREEMLHFHQVMRLLIQRHVKLTADEKDPYVNALLKEVRHHQVFNLLDRLIVFGVIEARGTERFGRVGQNHPESEMREFYFKLAEAEARHHQLFVDLARLYFSEEQIADRLEHFLSIDAELQTSLEIRPAVH